MPSYTLDGTARSCIAFPPVQHQSVMFGINPTILSSHYSIFSTLALDSSCHSASASVSGQIIHTNERAHIPK